MLAIAVLLTCLMITVMITDITRFIIPNLLVLSILLLYPAVLYFAPTMPDWQSALLIGLASFAVGFVIFIFNLMGGGDIKLFTVAAIFVGKDNFFEFLMLVSLMGGCLALLLVAIRPIVPFIASKCGKIDKIPKVLTVGQPAPYGVAIALGFIMLLWAGKIAGVNL